MPILEVIKAGDVHTRDKVREKGEDESGWVIVDSTEPKASTVVIYAAYEGETHVFKWGEYRLDEDLEAER